MAIYDYGVNYIYESNRMDHFMFKNKKKKRYEKMRI